MPLMRTNNVAFAAFAIMIISLRRITGDRTSWSPRSKKEENCFLPAQVKATFILSLSTLEDREHKHLAE